MGGNEKTPLLRQSKTPAGNKKIVIDIRLIPPLGFALCTVVGWGRLHGLFVGVGERERVGCCLIWASGCCHSWGGTHPRTLEFLEEISTVMAQEDEQLKNQILRGFRDKITIAIHEFQGTIIGRLQVHQKVRSV